MTANASNQKRLKYLSAGEPILNIVKQFDSCESLEHLKGLAYNYAMF